MKPTPPSEDLELATELALVFRTCTKAGRGLAWIDHGEPGPLAEICDAAGSLDAFEVGIFLVHRDGSGFVYWTTRAPDLYNTTVLEQTRWRDRDGS